MSTTFFPDAAGDMAIRTTMHTSTNTIDVVEVCVVVPHISMNKYLRWKVLKYYGIRFNERAKLECKIRANVRRLAYSPKAFISE